MDLKITDKAVQELQYIYESQNFDSSIAYVRLSVAGGGCSGFQHRFFIDEIYNEKLDVIVELSGLKFVIDKRSALYVEGTIIDFSEDLNKRGFKFTNPTIKSVCGCGSSFTI